jgi:hypothetical protein
VTEELEGKVRRRNGISQAARRLRRLLWLVVPLACFGSLEFTARRWQRVQPPVREDIWTAKEHGIRPDLPLNYIFIGSSRVAAAVDDKVFETAMARELGHPVQVVNFGQGYTCMIQHYLNLRNLARKHPEQMRGCTLFIEAFGGMPEASLWNGRWFYPGWSHQLVPLLCSEDLQGLWASTLTAEERLQLNEDVRTLTDVLRRHCALLRNRDRMSNELMALGQRLLAKAASKVFRRRPTVPPQVADLTTAGGIRNDLDGVQLGRKLALDWAKSMGANQSHCRLGEQSVELDLIRLMKSLGGQVVYFEMPIHSVQAAVFQTPIRRADREFFHGQMSTLGVAYLTTDCVVKDEDLPDYWHLRKSRSPDFTKALARAWMENSRPRLTAQRPQEGPTP